jgi:hypothetical protein
MRFQLECHDGGKRSDGVQVLSRPPGKLTAALQKAGVEFIAENGGGGGC